MILALAGGTHPRTSTAASRTYQSLRIEEETLMRRNAPSNQSASGQIAQTAQ